MLKNKKVVVIVFLFLITLILSSCNRTLNQLDKQITKCGRAINQMDEVHTIGFEDAANVKLSNLDTNLTSPLAISYSNYEIALVKANILLVQQDINPIKIELIGELEVVKEHLRTLRDNNLFKSMTEEEKEVYEVHTKNIKTHVNSLSKTIGQVYIKAIKNEDTNRVDVDKKLEVLNEVYGSILIRKYALEKLLLEIKEITNYTINLFEIYNVVDY